MLTIYHNPRCRKSRETLKLIQDSGVDHKIVEYLKEPPTEDQIHEIITKLGLPVEYVIRKNESIYKENFKAKEIDTNDWYGILADNPILIERPIVVNNGEAILGRPPENVKKFLP